MFRIETSDYESPRITRRFLKEDPTFDPKKFSKIFEWTKVNDEESMGVCPVNGARWLKLNHLTKSSKNPAFVLNYG